MSWLSEQNLSSASNSRVSPERTQKQSCTGQRTLGMGALWWAETNRASFHIKGPRSMLTGKSCLCWCPLWLTDWIADDGLTKGQHSSFQKFCWIYLTFLCTTASIHEGMVRVLPSVWCMAFFIGKISYILECILEIYCNLCLITTLILKS